MVLLSDFLRCFDLERISCSDVLDVLKRLNLYYEDYDDLRGSKFAPFEFVGFTRVFSDSTEEEFKFVYLFRSRGASGSYLFSYDFSALLNSLSLYCRPKRAWRDWFNDSLLPF